MPDNASKSNRLQMAMKSDSMIQLNVDVISNLLSSMAEFCLAAFKKCVEDVTSESEEAIKVRLDDSCVR